MREGQLRVVTGEPGNDGRLEPEEEDMPCFIFLVMDAMERRRGDKRLHSKGSKNSFNNF